jgi:hypothetical protein
MAQEKTPNLKPLFPDVSFTLNPPSANSSYLFMAKMELAEYDLIFEVENKQFPSLKIKLNEKKGSCFIPYGNFTSFEVQDILQHVSFIRTSQYFPRSFDDLNLTNLQFNKLQAILSLALCVL